MQHYLNFITKQLPHLSIHTYQFNDSGWDNFAVIINEEWLFRFPRKLEYALKIPREKQLWDTIAPKLHPYQVEVPHYTIINETGQAPSCSYYQLISGDRLTSTLFHALTAEQQIIIAKQIAGFLATLHSSSIEMCKQWGFRNEQNKQYWQKIYTRLVTSIFPLLTTNEQKNLQRLFQSYEEITKNDLSEAMIHADLTHSHILLDVKRQQISGIIDMGDGQIGDPAFDFAGLYGDYGDAFTTIVFTYYKQYDLFPHDTSFYDRIINFYQFSPVLHDLVFGLETNSQAIIETNVQKLRTVLK
ncbi:aminoglycoside phosphotransferase family protein [Microbacteriaceae bacterium 4G12]